MKPFFLLFTFYCLAVNAQWTEKFTYQNASYIWDLEAIGDNVLWGSVFLSEGKKGIVKTTDGGNTWFTDTLDVSRITCMHARSATTAYCGILDNSNIRRIIKTTDGGTTWVVQNSAFGGNPADLWVERIYFFDDNNGFAFGDQENGYNIIYTTTNGGDNWVQVPNTNIPPSNNNEFPINTTYYINGNTIWIPVSIFESNQVRIFKSTDKGYTWTASNAFSTVINNLLPSAIVFENQMEGILIVSRGVYNNTSTYKIYKTSDGGDTWTEITFPLPLDPAYMCGVIGCPGVFVVTAPLTNIGSALTLDGGNSWQLLENSLDLAITTFTSGTVGWSTSWNSPIIYKWSGPLLPGTYTIGTGGNFTTIQDAFNKLETDGVAGNVTLELTDDLYTAPTDSFGFKLNGPISGTGPDSRITIKPAENKNVVIEGDGRSTLSLWNTSYFTFDGVSTEGSTTLTIHHLYNAAFDLNRGITFANNSDHNIVRNLTLIGEDLYRYGDAINFLTTLNSTLATDSNIVELNFVKKGAGCVTIGAYYAATNVRPTGNIIRNNKFGSETDSLYSWGIQLERCKNTIVENNIIQNQKVTTTYGNDIINVGINSFWGEGDIIRNNIVHNIKSTNGYTCTGILLSCGNGNYGNNNMVYNNMVYDIQSTSSQSTSRVAGIELWCQNNPMIYYNSVYLSGSGANQQGSAAFYVYGGFGGSSGVDLKNNIFVNTRDESPYCASAIFDFNIPYLSSDYNDLYYDDSNSNNCLVRIGNTNYNTLSDWQAAGKDSNSVSEMPNFISPYLHINGSIATLLDNGATPISEIETDFDGQTRNATTPDIGADEFTIVGVEEEEILLTEYSLIQNYPNPFNPNTKIKYSIPQTSQVQIKVFDVLGNEIETLVNEEKPAGTYELNWNAANLSSGVYFYQLKAGSFVETKKMLLLK